MTATEYINQERKKDIEMSGDQKILDELQYLFKYVKRSYNGVYYFDKSMTRPVEIVMAKLNSRQYGFESKQKQQPKVKSKKSIRKS